MHFGPATLAGENEDGVSEVLQHAIAQVAGGALRLRYL